MPRLQKTLIGLSTIALAVILVLIFYTEYGTGYSEEQRRHWNELLAASKNEEGWCVSYAENHFEEASKEMQAVVSRKKAEDCPSVPISTPQKVNLASLPPEGLTHTELVNLAETGQDQANADACLELAFRLLEQYDDSYFVPTLIQGLEKWLGKAMKMNRQGASFLLECCRNNIRFDPFDDSPFDFSSFQGYDSFLSAVRNGDLPLYKVWSALINPTRGGINLSTSRYKAWSSLYVRNQTIPEAFCSAMHENDVIAKRNRAYQFFLHQPKHLLGLKLEKEQLIQEKIANEYSRTYFYKFTDANIPIKEEYVQSAVLALFKITGLCKKKELITALNLNTALLKQAADQGDMLAKYLWLSRGLQHKDFFTKEEWESVYSYTQDLLKAGFAPIYDDMAERDNSYEKNKRMHYAFYKKDSMLSLMTIAHEAGFSRGSRSRIRRNINRHTWDNRRKTANDNNIISLLTLLSRIDTQGLLDHCGLVFCSSSDIVQKHFIPLLEKASAKGYSQAQYHLAHAHAQGIGTPQNPGKAWELFQQLDQWIESFHSKSIYAEWTYKNRKMHYSHAINCSRIHFVLLHGDQPGMTLQQAWTKCADLIKKHNDERAKTSLRETEKSIFVLTMEAFSKEFEKRGVKLPEEIKP